MQSIRLDVAGSTEVTNLFTDLVPPPAGTGSDAALIRSDESSLWIGSFCVNHFLLYTNSAQRKSVIPLGFVIGVATAVAKKRRVMRSTILACPMISGNSLKDCIRLS